MRERVVWAALDLGLTALHLGLVLALLSLWLPRPTRRFHLLLVALTALSWFGLGFIHGIGYCFLSDWHWQVKRWRGEADLPASFIHYALTRWLGLPLRETTSHWLTGAGFALAGGLSLALNYRDWRERRRARERRA